MELRPIQRQFIKAATAPGIFNSDPGSQYTSEVFTSVLEDPDIRIRMEGKGAGRDNVLVEKFWRSVKYEEGYLNADESMHHAKQRLGRCFTGITKSASIKPSRPRQIKRIIRRAEQGHVNSVKITPKRPV